MQKLKINLHITNRCNYHCRYCFGKFQNADMQPEKWEEIIGNIKGSQMIDAINFAGGEPFLYQGIEDVIQYAKEQGFSCSVITNGSLPITQAIPYLDMLGISFDSANAETLVKLGCCSGKVLSIDDIKKIIVEARKTNPNIKIKINTVVTKENAKERLADIVETLKIDRWKILKAKPFDKNKELIVSDETFTKYVKKNKTKRAIIENDLTRSYIMVDNTGNLVDNLGDKYTIIGNLLQSQFSDLMEKFNFDQKAYWERYIPKE